MADEKKVKKTKKKAAEEAPPPAEEAPAPAPAPVKKASTRKAAKRSGSQVFSDKQLGEFKEVFNFLDQDKDGIIGKNDLRATYDAMGKIANDRELDDMLGEASGALNLTMLLQLFGSRMAGSADDEEVVQNAFRLFDENGKIDSEKFRHALTTWGDKFSGDEVDDAYDEFTIDNQGRIDTGKLIALLTSSAEEEEEEEA